jgi:NADPH2:quinone reductase
MKAVRIHEYGGPEVLIYEDVPVPEPGPTQVLVRLAAASVNRVDAAVRENDFPTPKQPPKTLGSDGAGVVELVGESVTAVRPGERVYFSGLGVGSDGSYAEFALIAEAQAVPIPSALSYAQAAALGMAAPTAYYALVRRGNLMAGETILVQGSAGGVGSAAVQLAKARGARVLATVHGAEQAKLVRELGADDVIDFTAEDVVARVLELTGGNGVDLVHELVISANLPADLRLVAKGGRIVCTGQGTSPEVTLPIGPALAKDVSLLFMSLNNAGRAGVAAIAREVAELAAAGDIQPVIGATLPLAEARRAHEMLAGKHLGKIILEIAAIE